MAKPKAPLFGFGASGKLGDALVYGSWKGIDVAREYVVPANPQTAAQTTQRGFFTTAVTNWHGFQSAVLSNALDKASWNRYAGVLGRMSGFNSFVRLWVNELVDGGTPLGYFIGFAVTDTLHNSMDLTVNVFGGTNQNVTARWGNSKTFFPFSDTAAMAAGVYTMAAEDSKFPAGETIYMYFEVGTAGTNYARSGLYTILLT